MIRWDGIVYLMVAGAMFLNFVFAIHAFNENNICEGFKCFAGIVLLGLGYIATLLREICDQRRNK